MKISTRWLIAGIVIFSILVTIILIGEPPVSIEVASIENRPLVVTVEEQGKTRAKDPFIVAAPIAGRLLRSPYHEGDTIKQGQTLTQVALAPSDSRSESIFEANLVSAEARYVAIEATLMESESIYARALREEERRGELFKNNLVSSEENELYLQALDVALARLLSNQASLNAAEAEIEAAKSNLLGITWDNETSTQDVTAPVDGTIYRVFEESERVIQAGTPLFSISNDDTLEIVVDLLTQDAIQVESGDLILITGWGGDSTLYATVRNIEPQAFTKISALGVEEQRVNVIGEFIQPPHSLGAEYRIEAAIIVWEDNEALTIPVNAIFQRNNAWNTFVVEDGKAKLRLLEIGKRSREHAQVLDGIIEGERVILFPSSLIKDGVKVSFENSP